MPQGARPENAAMHILDLQPENTTILNNLQPNDVVKRRIHSMLVVATMGRVVLIILVETIVAYVSERQRKNERQRK